MHAVASICGISDGGALKISALALPKNLKSATWFNLDMLDLLYFMVGLCGFMLDRNVGA